ncbi:hypothetical protein H9Y04_39975 [Streptomyces sp. TRM66268-LWL]|uniref:Uridine kinase n=1 Tax=Streptomyces polyasparticus TaxID=2767826 RepID=A0ABR7SWL3_9ACTN|nr:hypothetical protein [Streptomyces polyasparticus]MBC9718723.1 hypothetical protein [Streptomyces polyasparticus]
MTFASSDAEPRQGLADRLAHVRWIAGGTAGGKSTLTRLLAERHNVEVYDGDRAEHAWLERSTPQRHPHFTALRDLPPGAMWRERTGQQVFESMPGLHGETVGFLVEDLLGFSGDRIVLVDYFGVLPEHIAPLLRWTHQAVFLLPTAEFRENALATRYTDRSRARGNWGNEDPAATFAKRLVRDAHWDREVRRQAELHDLPTITIDGSVPASVMADRLALRFGLRAPDRDR